MNTTVLYSIENKTKTTIIKYFNIFLFSCNLILFFLFIVLAYYDQISVGICLLSMFFTAAMIGVISYPYFILRKKYAVTMMVDDKGAFTYDKKGEIVDSILYDESIVEIFYYSDSKNSELNQLRIKIKDENGNIKTINFPRIYYIVITNKYELYLHFLNYAKQYSSQIIINPSTYQTIYFNVYNK